MQTYYISGSNVFTLRTKPTGSQSLTLHLQDMLTLKNTSSSISPYTFDPYQSTLSFSASINGAKTGDEYRAYISDSTCSIWHGSIQVYASQSIDKPNYTNQIPLEYVYKSHLSDNEYIILD
jgi:hypothetical protein